MTSLTTLCACQNVVYNTVAQTIVNFAWNMWKTQKAVIMNESIATF